MAMDSNEKFLFETSFDPAARCAGPPRRKPRPRKPRSEEPPRPHIQRGGACRGEAARPLTTAGRPARRKPRTGIARQTTEDQLAALAAKLEALSEDLEHAAERKRPGVRAGRHEPSSASSFPQLNKDERAERRFRPWSRSAWSACAMSRAWSSAPADQQISMPCERSARLPASSAAASAANSSFWPTTASPRATFASSGPTAAPSAIRRSALAGDRQPSSNGASPAKEQAGGETQASAADPQLVQNTSSQPQGIGRHRAAADGRAPPSGAKG